jgi:hypothetical protein
LTIRLKPSFSVSLPKLMKGSLEANAIEFGAGPLLSGDTVFQRLKAPRTEHFVNRLQ